jgi:hypothetical protein
MVGARVRKIDTNLGKTLPEEDYFSIVEYSIPPTHLATKLYTKAPIAVKIKPKIKYKNGMIKATPYEVGEVSGTAIQVMNIKTTNGILNTK